jgi:hypothetical protein
MAWRMKPANFALHAICEGRSPFAKGSGNNRYFEKGTPTLPEFIANSSGVGTNAGLHAHPCAPQ